MKRRWKQILVGVVISAAALSIALQGAKAEVLVDRMSRVRWDLIFLSGFLYFGLVIVLRAFVVTRLLKGVKTIPVAIPYRYILIGFLANNILPARLGELARPILLSRRVSVPLASTLAAMALERMLDLVMVALLTAAAGIIASIPGAMKLAAAVTGAGMVSLFVFLAWASRRVKNGRPFIPGWVPARFAQRFEKHARLFSEGLSSLGDRRQFLAAFLCSLGLWVVMVPVLSLRIDAFGLDLPFHAGLFLLVALSFSLSLPQAPGYVGVYHLAAVFALGAYGVSSAEAVAFAIFSHALDFVAVSGAGFLSLLAEGVSWKEISGASTTESGREASLK